MLVLVHPVGAALSDLQDTLFNEIFFFPFFAKRFLHYLSLVCYRGGGSAISSVSPRWADGGIVLWLIVGRICSVKGV